MKYANLKRPRAGSTYFAYLAIPVAVQHRFGGRKFFQQSTGAKDPRIAHALAAPLLANWRSQIKAAGLSPMDAKIAAMGKSDFDKMYAWWVARMSKLGMPTDPVMPVSLPGPATPVLAHLDAWIASKPYENRSMEMAIGHVRKFAGEVGCSIEGMATAAIQKWCDTMRDDAANTIHNRLYSVKSYWKFMRLRGIPVPDLDFSKIEVKGRSDAAPERFDPKDMPKIIEGAYRIHEPLGHLTMIAAYSGIRREAIGRLRVPDVKWTEVPHFMIRIDKTLAGRRQVPIHTHLHDLIVKLSKDADQDGYLIHSTACGDLRTDPLGKRFGKMKKAMGYDARFDFHSIRRTVVHLFEIAECPEGICQDIVGHKKRGLTYGTYSGVTPLDLRAEWLERAVRY